MKKTRIIKIGIVLLALIFVTLAIPLLLFPDLYDVGEHYFSGFFFNWNVFFVIAVVLVLFSLGVIVLNAKKTGVSRVIPSPDNHFLLSAFALIFFALIIVISAIIIECDETVRSTLILTGFTSFMMGFIVMTFHQDEPAFLRALPFSPVADTMNACTALQKLGIAGNAHICEKTGGHCLFQYNPGIAGVSFESIPKNSGTGPGSHGIVLIPTGYAALQRLEGEYRMTLPDNDALLAEFIVDLYVRQFDLADSADVRFTGDTAVVTLQGYRQFSHCSQIEQHDAGCCARVPCPFCSLLACIIAQSGHTPVAFESIVPDGGTRTIRLKLRRDRQRDDSAAPDSGT